MGLSGNLTTGEILEQVVHADRILAEEWKERQEKENSKQPKLDLVRNIVFMGQGGTFTTGFRLVIGSHTPHSGNDSGPNRLVFSPSRTS